MFGLSKDEADTFSGARVARRLISLPCLQTVRPWLHHSPETAYRAGSYYFTANATFTTWLPWRHGKRTVRGQLSVVARRHGSLSGSDRLIHPCTTPLRSTGATNPPFRSVIGRQRRRSAVSAIRLEWLKPSKNVTLYLYHAHPLPPSATRHSPQPVRTV